MIRTRSQRVSAFSGLTLQILHMGLLYSSFSGKIGQASPQAPVRTRTLSL